VLATQVAPTALSLRVTTASSGNVPEGDRDAQPGDLESGREFTAFVVHSSQDVTVPLYGIQNTFKTGAIPVTYNFAA
jgi:hypothetical protein